MLSFIGEYNCKADSKFRISVPAMFRKVMATEGSAVWVLRRNTLDSCIDMYPMGVWNETLALLKNRLNPFNKKHSQFFREFCRGTQLVECDANGRVLLPKKMLDAVGISKDMILAGMDDKVQIWNPEEYDRVAICAEDLADLAQDIFKD